MSTRFARFAKVVGILAATAALASPALVNAESSRDFGRGGQEAHFAARGVGRAEVGRAYSGRAYSGRAYSGRAYSGRAYSGRAYVGRAYAAPRYAAGYAGSRGWVGRAYVGARLGGYRVAWGGGWWNGYYWPRAYYGWAYPWFLAALPIGYATYWWGGMPYYYVNDVYYVWNPTDNGYVVTDPPPVADENALPANPDGTEDYSAPPADAAPPPSGAPPAQAAPPGAGSPDDVYMYPMNGQTDQQQATDRYECHQWAQQQTGFDPTQPASQSSGNAYNYHRAMVACLQGRGYSVN